MAKLTDNNAIILEVISGVAKSGRSYKMAKISLSGTGSACTAFVADDAPTLPPARIPFAIQTDIAANKNGDIGLVINNETKFGKAE